MDKITYLLGAGASYGTRDNTGHITRGFPIISEFKYAIDQVVVRLQADRNNTNVSDVLVIVNELNWLSEKCELYPTIDTYAKMLYVTKNIKEYNRLKTIISIFFMLEQYYLKHDLRYDGFIASLINEQCKFPPINILTWNYDVQIEKSYSDYNQEGKYISSLWKNLNITSKTFQGENLEKGAFSITRLNGAALFIDKEGETIIDIVNGGYQRGEIIPVVKSLLTYSLYTNMLSYSWESINTDFLNSVIEKVKATTILIVIGYSFPYVNRYIDRAIIQKMENLDKIYIQDPLSEDIKESVSAILLDKMDQVDVITKINTKQFFIPNEL